MGALISHKHILTSKFCFGTGDGDSYVLRWSEDKLKDIVKVMLGAGESYPWGFPHTTELDVVQESLDSSIIVWSDVEEIKQLPNEVFCILTMQKYVPFRGNRRPLCLPADPNQFYKQIESKRVEVLGFGYDSQSYNDVKSTAIDEVRLGRFKKYTRSMTKETYGVISRKNCYEQLRHPLLEIM